MEASKVTPALPQQKSKSNKFLYARLHSLAGIIPLGLFLVEHIYTNALAIFGSEKYNEQIHLLQSIPFLMVVEIVFIAIPLLFHAIYGIYLGFISKNNANQYTYKRNLLFLFQRMSGIIILIFVAYHVWSFRISTAITGTEVNYNLVSEHLQNPLIFAFYVIGVISTAFHFCNGLSTGLITWGITIGKKSQKVSTQVSLVLFFVISVISILTLTAFI